MAADTEQLQEKHQTGLTAPDSTLRSGATTRSAAVNMNEADDDEPKLLIHVPLGEDGDSTSATDVSTEDGHGTGTVESLPATRRQNNEKKRDGPKIEALRNSQGDYVCPICSEITSSPHDFTVHIRQHNPTDHSHTCRLCGKTLSSASSLDRHMLVHSGERPFKCRHCDMAFTTNGNMHRHMRTHNSALLHPTIVSKLLAAPTLLHLGLPSVLERSNIHSVDHIADQASISSSQFSVIESSHSNDVPIHDVSDLANVDFTSSKFPVIAKDVCERINPKINDVEHSFQCSICKKVFPCSASLELHVASHNDLIVCSVCHSKFITFTELRTHNLKEHNINISHESQEIFLANLELKITEMSKSGTLDLSKRVGVLQVHDENLSHDSIGTAADTLGLGCNMCGMVFKNNHLLKRHQQLHINTTTPFACTICSYVSTDKSTLIRHLRTHNGERPFQCSICKYAFTTKANCERHVRKRHNKQTKNEIRDSMQYNPHMSEPLRIFPDFLPADTGNQDTICKYCNKDFKFNRVLRHHLRSLNNSCSRKPFCCTVCKLGFSTKNNCIRHVLKQHPEKKDRLLEAVSSTPMEIGEDDIPSLTFEEQNDSSSALEHSDMGISSRSNTPAELNFSSVPMCLQTMTNNSCTPSLERILSASQLNSIAPPMSNSIVPEVNAIAETLIDLSNVPPPQEEPLDLVVRALDLRRQKSESEIEIPPLGRPPSSTKTAQSLPSNSSTRDSTEDSDVEMIDISQIKKEENCSKTPKMFTCPHCPTAFTLKSNMERHVKRKHPDIVVSPFVAMSPTLLASTMSDKTRTALKTVLCSKKEKIDDNNTEINGQKIKEESDINASTDLASVTSLINTANSFQQILDTDCSIKSEINEKSKRNSYADSPNSVTCKFCKRKFPWTSSLRRHLLTHTGQKPFKCPHCPINFTTKSNCERHLLRKHGRDAGVPTMVSFEDCISSLRSSHDRPFKCDLCPGSTFSTQGNLTKHFVQKHGCSEPLPTLVHRESPQLQTFHCDSCSLYFKSQAEYLLHLSIEHRSPIEKGSEDDVEHFGKKSESLSDVVARTTSDSVSPEKSPAQPDESSDLLQNLLGIQDSRIVEQLFHSTADSAARLLGVHHGA